MNNLTILGKSIKFQILIYLRIKQAVFFTLIFPIIIFIIFGNIWGFNKGYLPFILSGVIGMTVASEGFFSVGSVIREYYTNGLIKYLRKFPFNVLFHFAGLIISRVISLIIIILILCVLSYFVFGFMPSTLEILYYVLGAIVGLAIFSFLGLCLSFSGIKGSADRGLTNIVFFIILFTSMAFYPVKYFNKTIGTMGDCLPLNPVLNILRGEEVNYIILVCWLIVPMLVFYFLFKRIKFSR